MTVLNYSEVLNFSWPDVWRRVTGFSKELPGYLPWIEKAEWLAGNPQGIGGRWSFQTRTSAGLWPLDLEITEWLEGERIALMPFGISGIFKDIQLFQILVELKDKPTIRPRSRFFLNTSRSANWDGSKTWLFSDATFWTALRCPSRR